MYESMHLLKAAECDRAIILARASVVGGMIGISVWQNLVKETSLLSLLHCLGCTKQLQNF